MKISPFSVYIRPLNFLSKLSNLVSNFKHFSAIEVQFVISNIRRKTVCLFQFCSLSQKISNFQENIEPLNSVTCSIHCTRVFLLLFSLFTVNWSLPEKGLPFTKPVLSDGYKRLKNLKTIKDFAFIKLLRWFYIDFHQLDPWNRFTWIHYSSGIHRTTSSVKARPATSLLFGLGRSVYAPVVVLVNNSMHWVKKQNLLFYIRSRINGVF